jgi:hypothetical protein
MSGMGCVWPGGEVKILVKGRGIGRNLKKSEEWAGGDEKRMKGGKSREKARKEAETKNQTEIGTRDMDFWGIVKKLLNIVL